MKVSLSKSEAEILLALGVSSLSSIILLGIRFLATSSLHLYFLIWNLVLAWIPFVISWQLRKNLRAGQAWSRRYNVLLSFVWLGFLPNSFYIITDFIHLSWSGPSQILYDVALLASFTFNGFVLGFASLYWIHLELAKRLKGPHAHSIIAGILLACSFAIYLGRYLRWNTWDVLFRPAGLLFDVTDRLINPTAHGRTFVTTSTFFVLLATQYLVVWTVMRRRADLKVKS